MKLNKIFAIALAAITLSACSDDDDFNTAGDVTVSMEQSTMTVDENSDLFYVPIIVTGTSNGPIQVRVTVAENGSTPATADENYLVTTKTINIGKGESVGNVEIIPVDDRFQNADRTFTVTITSASGAKVGQQSSCLITLKDNDATLYGRLQGKWTMTGIDAFTGGEVSIAATISGMNAGEEGYGETLFINFNPDGNAISIMTTLVQTQNGGYALKADLGQVTASGIPYSEYRLDLLLFALDPAQGYYRSGYVGLAINADENEITWPSAYILDLFAMALRENQYLQLGDYYAYENPKWVRE